MSKIILRPYQEDLINNSRKSLAKNKRIITQSPTGSGKTVTLARMAKLAFYKGQKVMIVSHRIEIVNQNAKACRQDGIPVTIISAKLKKLPQDVIVCSAMAQTIKSRLKKPELGYQKLLKEINLLIIDECHDSNANFLFQEISEKCFVVGFSATPVRYGKQRQLGMDYNDIVPGPQVKELIANGSLCRCRHFGLDAPKLDDVEYDPIRGDYVLSQMQKKFESKPQYEGVVNNWERLAKGTKTIVFCCSSVQAIEITKQFCERGYDAKYSLSGSFDDDDTYSAERKKLMQEFKDDKFNILVNVGQMVAGVDVPAIKTCILCYSTISLTKYLQCLGRASRPHPTKEGEFICLDMGSNYERLGMYENDRKWYLWHDTSKGGGPAPVKECPKDNGGCGRLIPIQVSDCPFCGYHFPSTKEIYEVHLQEIVNRKANTEKETIDQYVARKKLEGWKNNWILRDLCQKNPDNQKDVFMQAIKILRDQHGEKINPNYWYMFEKYILEKKKRKK